MGQELRRCYLCGSEYLSGLFAAHRMLAHQGPKAKDPNRVFSCPQCHGRYPASQRTEHVASIEHRNWMLLNTDLDVIGIAEAYERGDRVKDIQSTFGLVPPDVYRALQIAGVEKRGLRTFPAKEIGQRGHLARTVGDRWRNVRRLRKQGKSWAEIEAVYP